MSNISITWWRMLLFELGNKVSPLCWSRDRESNVSDLPKKRSVWHYTQYYAPYVIQKLRTMVSNNCYFGQLILSRDCITRVVICGSFQIQNIDVLPLLTKTFAFQEINFGISFHVIYEPIIGITGYCICYNSNGWCWNFIWFNILILVFVYNASSIKASLFNELINVYHILKSLWP